MEEVHTKIRGSSRQRACGEGVVGKALANWVDAELQCLLPWHIPIGSPLQRRESWLQGAESGNMRDLLGVLWCPKFQKLIYLKGEMI